MAGHMGAKYRTTLGLEVVETDLENNLLYLKGAVPGSKNTYVEIKEAVKNKNKSTINERVEKYKVSLAEMKSVKKEKRKNQKKMRHQKLKSQPPIEEKKIMKIEEISIDGKSIGTIEGSDKVFKVKPRKDIIQQVVDWQQNRNFKKKGHTKSRGEVKGSRKKIVQQKGSGGARHGNITAPIFVGGGIAHGPRHKGKNCSKKT